MRERELKLNPIETGQACWVVLPVKALGQAKSRLAPVLTPAQRRNLATHLLERTLRTLQAMCQRKLLAGFVVTSADPQVLQLAKLYNGYAFAELEEKNASATTQLNLALGRAGHWVSQSFEVTALLLLPSDLPLLEIKDISAMLDFLALYPLHSLAVIAPDRHQKGTNALLLRPPGLLNFQYLFGEQSFEQHLEALRQITGVQTFICQPPGLIFDLDRPADLATLPDVVRQRLLQK